MNLDLIPFDRDKAIDLTDAAQRIKCDRKGRCNVSLVQRWAKDGYRPRGYQGDRIVLPTVLIGGRRWLMPQWLEAWETARVAMGSPVPVNRPKRRTPRQAEAAHRRAAERLEARGMKVGGPA